MDMGAELTRWRSDSAKGTHGKSRDATKYGLVSSQSMTDCSRTNRERQKYEKKQYLKGINDSKLMEHHLLKAEIW